METERTYPHLQQPSDGPARLARLPRVRVAQIVMDYLAYGWSADEMCRQHPHLKPAEVHAAMAYYYDHQEQMDKEISSEFGKMAAMHARSPFYTRLHAKGLLRAKGRP